MEKQLSFVLMLPLKQIVLRRIAVGLWTEPDILTSIAKFQGKIGWKEKWRETVECKVSGKISKLQLPESLAKQIMQVLKPIGLQILRWKKFHEFYLSQSEYLFPWEYFDVPILEKLLWTAAATVDYRKTAEELVSCNVFEILARYKLACLYCLDTYIPELWKELPQEDKMYFYDEKGLSNIKQPLLQFCWPYMLKDEEYKLDVITGRSHGDQTTFHQCMFTRLSMDGNKSAAEYFFQMLSPVERETSLNKIARNSFIGTFSLSFPKENVSEILIYLLSQMTPEQRIEIFRKRPADILGCFLYWPWQEVFVDFADAMWMWVRCEDLERRAKNYDALLDKLQDSVKDSDCCLSDLYQSFFLHCPGDFKKHFVNQECQRNRYSSFFRQLFYVRDVETINVILSNVDAGDRLRLASSRHVLKHFYAFISTGKGRLVETCLRDTGLAKEDKASLKKAFVRWLKRRNGGAIESPECRRFFEFLDETESRAQIKRITDDETLTEAKKLLCKRGKL